VVAFYNQRGNAEQYIKEGKHSPKWTRPSCGKFRNIEIRLQLHALAYNLANIMLPDGVKRDTAPLVLGLSYDFHEVGGHLRNAG
jgi:hypothetical protein